jgi:hypothetical protein
MGRYYKKELKKQALIEFEAGNDQYELVFMISPQLTTEAILRSNFLNEYHVVVDFANRCFMTEQGCSESRHSFSYDVTADGASVNRQVLYPNQTVLQAFYAPQTKHTRPKQANKQMLMALP